MYRDITRERRHERKRSLARRRRRSIVRAIKFAREMQGNADEPSSRHRRCFTLEEALALHARATL